MKLWGGEDLLHDIVQVRPFTTTRRVRRGMSTIVGAGSEEGKPSMTAQTTRRAAITYPFLSAAMWQIMQTPSAQAVQGYTAGRIPGLSREVDADGFRMYTRPAGKQGGHGVGWSEIPPYQFKVPDGAGWKEVPVSIADLGGTEIDLRFGSDSDGKCAIVVAPVMRFADISFNSDVRINQLGGPDKMISGFGPELFGSPLQDGDVLDTKVTEKEGVTFYQWELKPHRLVSATAYRNRVFLMALDANARQWRKSQKSLRAMWESFDLAHGLEAESA